MIKGKLHYINNKWIIKYTEEKWWQPPHAPGVFGPTYKDFSTKEVELHSDEVKYVEMFKDMAGGFMYDNTEVEFLIKPAFAGSGDYIPVYATIDKTKEMDSSLEEIDRLLSIRTKLTYEPNIEDITNDNIVIMENLQLIFKLLKSKI